MVGNRGYIRIVEAIIALVILFGVIIYVNQRAPEITSGVPGVVETSQEFILNEIFLDEDLRECAIGWVGSCVDSAFDCKDNYVSLIEDNLPNGYDYACEICDKSLSCVSLVLPHDKSVFTKTTFVSVGEDDEFSKVVRLYFWES